MLSLNRRKALFAAIASPFVAKKAAGEVVSSIGTTTTFPPSSLIGDTMGYMANSKSKADSVATATETLNPTMQLAADEAKIHALRAMGLDSTLEQYVRNNYRSGMPASHFIFHLKSVSPAIQDIWASDIEQAKRMERFYDVPKKRYMDSIIEQAIVKLKMDWWP